eukprot:scaffold15350_cov98-Isochrysis_galbana.AAC.3
MRTPGKRRCAIVTGAEARGDTAGSDGDGPSTALEPMDWTKACTRSRQTCLSSPGLAEPTATRFGDKTACTSASRHGSALTRNGAAAAHRPLRRWVVQAVSVSGSSAVKTRGGIRLSAAPRKRAVANMTVKSPPSAPRAWRVDSSSSSTLASGSSGRRFATSRCEMDVTVIAPPCALVSSLDRPRGPKLLVASRCSCSRPLCACSSRRRTSVIRRPSSRGGREKGRDAAETNLIFFSRSDMFSFRFRPHTHTSRQPLQQHYGQRMAGAHTV